jgi:hypothetical protein
MVIPHILNETARFRYLYYSERLFFLQGIFCQKK